MGTKDTSGPALLGKAACAHKARLVASVEDIAIPVSKIAAAENQKHTFYVICFEVRTVANIKFIVQSVIQRTVVISSERCKCA